MSDPDLIPDPIDKTYAEAEAMLADDAARAARRARVLAAVAPEPMAPAEPVRRPMHRPAGWLAAASVAGLGVFLAIRFYPPAERLEPAAAPAPVQESAPPSVVAEPAPSSAPTHAASPTPAPRASPAAPRVVETPPPPLNVPPQPISIAPSPPQPPVVSPPPPPAPVMRSMAFSAPIAQASAPPPGGAALVGGDARAAPAEALDSIVVTASKRVSPTVAAPPIRNRLELSAASPSDPAAGLRAAAAAGRTAEIEVLLARGVPVDAPDAEGETALMKSIRAGQPAAAALLRRHGASLDLKNHVGERARDLAMAKNDPALNEALGLEP